VPIIKSAGVLHFGSELRGPGACLRHGRDRPRRAAPRDCDPFYRNCQFHCACGDAGAQRTRNAAQSRLERPHSACRVNFYAPTLHRVVLNFFPRGACRCREEALRIRLSACRSKQLCSVMGGKRQPGPLLKVHTERDDYFRTSASFAVSISVRANHWPRSVSRAEPCRRFMNTENIPSRARSATVTPEMCLPSGVPHQ
jgi:hypothetical protein